MTAMNTSETEARHKESLRARLRANADYALRFHDEHCDLRGVRPIRELATLAKEAAELIPPPEAGETETLKAALRDIARSLEEMGDEAVWRSDLNGIYSTACDALKSLPSTWKADETEARRLIQKHRDQFAFYEQQHRAKKTPEADAKAEVNAALVAEAAAFLKRHPSPTMEPTSEEP